MGSLIRSEGEKSVAMVFIPSADSLQGCLRLAEFPIKGHSFYIDLSLQLTVALLLLWSYLTGLGALTILYGLSTPCLPLCK